VESRRFPRLQARCRVRIRDRFGVWDAETEDVGPRGCRIVTSRPQTVGALVSLTLESGRVPEALEVAGQVAWARADRPCRAGISFAGSATAPAAVGPSAWFDRIAAAEPGGHAASPPEIVIIVDPPVPAPDPLVDRMRRRAQELLGGGERARAAVLFQRVLVLAPGDAAVEAALRELSSH
jgi:hypothetical protein